MRRQKQAKHLHPSNALPVFDHRFSYSEPFGSQGLRRSNCPAGLHSTPSSAFWTACPPVHNVPWYCSFLRYAYPIKPPPICQCQSRKRGSPLHGLPLFSFVFNRQRRFRRRLYPQHYLPRCLSLCPPLRSAVLPVRPALPQQPAGQPVHGSPSPHLAPPH